MKLDLGAGDISPAGFTPMGNAHGSSLYPLSVADGSVEEIRASHVLEHFARAEVPNVLKEWVRALKPGGKLKVAVPDFAKIAENYISGVNEPTDGYVMGGQTAPDDFHKSIFDSTYLRKMMSDAGLVLLRQWQSELSDCASLSISLNLEGTKPFQSSVKVRGVMSAPRLGFNDMWNSAIRHLPKLNIDFRKVGGAFWGQTLTCGLESVIEENPDYVLVLDYDSVFNAEAASTLLQLAICHPEADAIAPMQANRHEKTFLCSFELPEGTKKDGDQVLVPAEFFDADLIRAKTAHFGLTLLKTQKLKTLPRPWFLPSPDEQGRWGTGRTDEDTHFWRQWEKAGNTLFIAPHITIGHLEVMVRWVGEDTKPVFQTAREWEATLMPPQGAWR